MVTEAQREQILALSETMSQRQIAEAMDVPKSTVAYILRGRGGPRKAKKGKGKKAPEDAQGGAVSPAPAPAPATVLPKPDRPTAQLPNIVQVSKGHEGVYLSPTMVATVALDHLISEIELYHEALREKDTVDIQARQTAEWKVINHEKLIQGHLKIISQWFGMDKGDVLKAIEDVRADPLAGMTKEELLALYTATGGA